MTATRSVWTVPPSVPFLPALADALMDGRLMPEGDPRRLSRATILLPTRRAAQRLAELLAARASTGMMLLPNIMTLGDIDTERLLPGAGDEGAGDEGAGDETDLSRFAVGIEADALLADLAKPPLAPIARELALTKLILHWGRTVAGSLSLPNSGGAPAAPQQVGEAANLARALAGLMDSLTIEEVDPSVIAKRAADQFSPYWDIMQNFLAIATQWWPRELVERGAADPLMRRNKLIDAYREALARRAGDEAVIAAGSTGSVPATSRLLRQIAGLPSGHVVLPGLDLDLDPASFAAITDPAYPHPGHPQFGLAMLLAALPIDRADVRQLQAPNADGARRQALLSNVMRPAAMTHLWAAQPPSQSAEMDRALSGLEIVEARDEREEALAIAIALREVLATPGRRGALVTPDRALARRVQIELGRWRIDVADSAGIPLAETAAGRLARLIAMAVARRLPVDLVVALLQHPLVELDDSAGRQAVRALEILALRGPRPAPWSGGIIAALDAKVAALDAGPIRHPVERQVFAFAPAAKALAARLSAALEPFETLGAVEAPMPLGALAAAHARAFRALTGLDPKGADEIGLVFRFIEELGTAGALDLRLAEYPNLLDTMMAGRTRPDRRAEHPRLAVLGTLEARLIDADLLVLGGLNEGVWPGDPASDPFLDRHSRADIGLPAPERRIGLAAHDFVQGAANRQVLLTRAETRARKPALPARWLQRLGAVIGPEREQVLADAGNRYVAWARALDRRASLPAFPEPRPIPPVDKRPRRISASRITTWIRDPYSLYAYAILRLAPLDPLNMLPGAAERGTFVHEALARYGQAVAKGASPSADLLLASAETELARLDIYPELATLWRRQFRRIAGWYLDWSARRHDHVRQSLLEERGVLAWDMATGPFTVSAIADRIDCLNDGTIVVTDYKTGQPPSASAVRSGLEPQLTIEAAMAQAGAWAQIDAGADIAALRYIKLSGGHPPGEEHDIAPAKDAGDLNQMAIDALIGLKRLVAAYDDPAQPYLVKPRVQFGLRYADYDHLSRYAEWSAMESGGDGDGSEA